MSLRRFVSRLSQCSRFRKKQHKNKNNDNDNNNNSDKHRATKGGASAIRVVGASDCTPNGLFKSDIRIIVTPATSRSVSEVDLWVPGSSEGSGGSGSGAARAGSDAGGAGSASSASDDASDDASDGASGGYDGDRGRSTPVRGPVSSRMRLRGGDLACAESYMPEIQDMAADSTASPTPTTPSVLSPPMALTQEMADDQRPWHTESLFTPESTSASGFSTPLSSGRDSPPIATSRPETPERSDNGTFFSTVSHVGHGDRPFPTAHFSPDGGAEDDARSDGRAALHAALATVDEQSLRQLVSRPDLDINSPFANTALTPLALALPHPPLLSLLLSRTDLQLNTSPYLHTAITSHPPPSSPAVALLLARHDLDANRCHPSTFDNETALATAVAAGNAAAVQLLLARKDVDINKAGGAAPGLLPIHLAVQRGDGPVLAMLLGREDADANRRDGRGRTALRIALDLGDAGAVEAILARGDVHVAPEEWSMVARLRDGVCA